MTTSRASSRIAGATSAIDRRARSAQISRALLFIALLGAGGCLDFADPTIPDRSAAAVLQANMRVFDQGILQIDGSLSPGRDAEGFQRPVPSPFIEAAGMLIEPRSLGETGVRSYSTSMAVPPRETLGPFVLVAPTVQHAGTLPVVTWYGLRRLDPDTLVIRHGDDIVLHMDTAAAQPDPPNLTRQWFLDVTAGGRTFRISATGAPPLTMRIPSDWVPPPQNNHALVTLIYYQSAQLRSPENLYIANVLLDVRLSWVVRFEPD
jgi:hypothetical protein